MSRPVYHVWIPTHNRPDLLLGLLEDLIRESEAQDGNVLVSVFDDGSTADYTRVRGLLAEQGWEWCAREHGGKEGFWKLIADAHGRLRKSPATYFVKLDDDLRLCRDFLRRATTLWNSIDDHRKLCLNVLLDRGRKDSTCWGGSLPVECGSGVRRVDWVDCIYFATRSFYDLLGWSFPRPQSWVPRNGRGSGVGYLTSTTFRQADGRMYQASPSLVAHRLTGSAMHDDFKPERGLSVLAHDFVDGSEDLRRLTLPDTVTVSICSIPSREHMLASTIASLLPQVDAINVILNGYGHVPAYLDHPKVRVARSQDIGDFRSDAKMWFAEEVAGFHVLCDDDLEYHPGFIEHLVLWMEHFDRKVVVGHHGVVLTQPFESYYRSRRIFHGMRPLDVPQWCHLVATCSCAYHASVLKLPRAEVCERAVVDEREHNMSDMVFAAQVQAQGLPVLCVGRSKAMYHQVAPDEGIFEHSRKGDGSVFDSSAIQTAFIRSQPPWVIRSIAGAFAPAQSAPAPAPERQPGPRSRRLARGFLGIPRGAAR